MPRKSLAERVIELFEKEDSYDEVMLAYEEVRHSVTSRILKQQEKLTEEQDAISEKIKSSRNLLKIVKPDFVDEADGA